MKRHVQALLAAALVCSVATAEPLAVAQLCTKAASVLQRCSTELPAVEQQRTCCTTVRAMQDLGCFWCAHPDRASQSWWGDKRCHAAPAVQSGEHTDFLEERTVSHRLAGPSQVQAGRGLQPGQPLQHRCHR